MVFLKTLGDTAMTKNQEEGKSYLNKPEESSEINRGFELMLRHRSRRDVPEPKTFGLKFGKIISLLKREIQFNFELSFTISKR